MELLSASKIEPIIFKMGMTEPRHASFLLEYFQSNFFENSVLGEVGFQIATKFFAERNVLPKRKTLELIADKMFAKIGESDNAVRAVKKAMDIDLGDYDIEFLEEQMIGYLKHAALFTTVSSSFEEMERTHSVTCLDELERYSNMSYNDALGFDYFEDFEDHAVELCNPEGKLSTGIDSLDEHTNGGYSRQGKNLIIFMAQPGMGKSLMLSNTAARYVKDNKFVVIISLEMSEFVYGKRVDAHLSGIDVNALDTNIESLVSKVKKIAEDNEQSKLVIKEFPPSSTSCAQIRNFIDTLVRKTGKKPDAIFVDYVNLLIPNAGTNGDNTYVNVGKCTKELRALSYFFECPVISATQVNRSAVGTSEIGMENISESMGIAHDADFIASLYQGEGDRENGIIRMGIEKNRLGGAIGVSLELDIDYSDLTISDPSGEGFATADMDDIFTDNNELGNI